MKQRVGVWLRRYLPAEVLSLVGALVAANVAWYLTNNAAATAVAGAWGETTAYYATMLFRELTRTSLFRALRDLLLEFGFAEALDSLFIRPALMYASAQLVSDLQLGTLLGKLGADVFFYVPTIAAYELRTRHIATTTPFAP